MIEAVSRGPVLAAATHLVARASVDVGTRTRQMAREKKTRKLVYRELYEDKTYHSS